MASVKLVYGTTNAGKISEVRRVAEAFGIHVIDLQTAAVGGTIQGVNEVAEGSDQYDANASHKAGEYAKWLRSPCLADDAGLEVEELGWLPGVYTARYGFERVSNKLTKGKSYKARFVCCAAYAEPTGRRVTATAYLVGEFILPRDAKQPTSTLPYSHFFIPDGYSCDLASLVREDSGFLSHRGRALVSLLKALF